jgi:hypothetical protein
LAPAECAYIGSTPRLTPQVTDRISFPRLKVISCPFFDWEGLNGDAELQQQYVGRKLARASSSLFGHFVVRE